MVSKLAIKLNFGPLLGAGALAIGLGAAAWYYNIGGFRTFLDTITPWRIVYINVNPPSPGQGVNEDDIKAAAQIVVSVIQVGAVTRQTPEQLQTLLENMSYDSATRQDLIDLVLALKALQCIQTMAVCDDAQSQVGAKAIADTSKKIAARFGIPLSPDAVA